MCVIKLSQEYNSDYLSDLSLVDELGSMRLAVRTAISEAFQARIVIFLCLHYEYLAHIK